MSREVSETDELSTLSSTIELPFMTKKHHKNKKTSKKKSKKRKEDKNRTSRKMKSYSEELKEKQPNDMYLLACGNNPSNEIEVSPPSYGPALPPNMLHNTTTQVTPEESNAPSNEQFIGPTLPFTETKDNDVTISSHNCVEIEDSPDDCYGPLPIKQNGEFSATQVQLEERALELKIASINGCLPSGCSTQNEREEWMIELPEVGIKSGLASIKSNKTSFYQGKNKPDLSDRSCWTKTPNDNVSKQKKEKANKAFSVKTAQEIYDKQRDIEQKALARKHMPKESLLEIHQKKLRKELERKSKKMKLLDEKPTRRPFTRDVDLKLNKIDSNHTRNIVAKPNMLNAKFACGQKEYL